MTTRRAQIMLWGLAALIVGIPVVSTISVVIIENRQHTKNMVLADALRASPEQQQSRDLVVYFSRSGNTELMALEIAKERRARVVQLVDAAYRIGLRGWLNAMRDARKQRAAITPEKIDLSGYDTIYVGSPIWLYSPAPPVWQFVQSNDLSGKRVILFNSLNSKFEQSYIDAFARLVRQKGGTFARHIFIVRGRMTRQMERLDFLAETTRLLREAAEL
ncbi:flavodoxin family protein [Bosea sp. 2KB_26]|uniref:flavodoxin family protein n=1 Tax=Bosea sp. 2KB_26 TaxID=3237475 RepID=UPI003F8F96A0